MKLTRFLLLAVSACICVGTTQAQNFLTPSDFIIAIDEDPASPQSDYPSGEAPLFALDNNPNTKYLNFGGDAGPAGFIFTPSAGATTIQSMMMNTANDAEGRDPATWIVFGTNDPISSVDNGDGNGEMWTQIAAGDAMLPIDRFAAGPVYSFPNSTAYTSYRVEFPTLRDNNNGCCMQIGDVNIFESTDASGAIVGLGDAALAYGPVAFESSYPAGENPGNVIDGTLNKYLNFGGANSGFIVTPGETNPLGGFRITTANDAPERTPSEYEVYGTNDAIVSADNGNGLDENWVLLDSGSLSLPATPDTMGSIVAVDNTDTYTSYKLVFTDLVDAGAANSMQLAEVEFFAVPEPGSAGALLLGGMILGMFRRRR